MLDRYSMALACQNAYADPPIGTPYDFDDCRAVITEQGGYRVIAVRGTRPLVLADDLRDLMSVATVDDPVVGRCADGFNQGAAGLFNLLTRIIVPGMVVVGHSLGGAIAANLAVRMCLDDCAPAYVFLLEPALSLSSSRAHVLGHIPGEVIWTGNDPVPRLPPDADLAHPYLPTRVGSWQFDPISCHLIENILPLLR